MAGRLYFRSKGKWLKCLIVKVKWSRCIDDNSQIRGLCVALYSLPLTWKRGVKKLARAFDKWDKRCFKILDYRTGWGAHSDNCFYPGWASAKRCPFGDIGVDVGYTTGSLWFCHPWRFLLDLMRSESGSTWENQNGNSNNHYYFEKTCCRILEWGAAVCQLRYWVHVLR
jgi:hypothetical protein